MRPVLKRSSLQQANTRAPATLFLNRALRQEIIEHAISGRPNEVCGLIGGDGMVGHMVLPLTNADSNPRICYRIDPVEFVAAYDRIERSGDELVGIYHS